MEKFEVGDYVQRIDHDWENVVVGGVYKVRDIVRTGIILEEAGEYTYDANCFIHHKETKVLQILRQWKDSR